MPTVRVTSASGRVHVVAEDRADVLVERGERSDADGVIEVSATSGGVGLRVPTGTDLFIGTASGRVVLEGRLGAVHLTSHSGRVDIEGCASLDARTKSGRMTANVDGPCRCNSVSGRIDITLDQAADVQVDSVSGAVNVVLPEGVCPHVVTRTMSGRAHVTVPSGDDAELQVRTVSGSISVVCEP